MYSVNNSRKSKVLKTMAVKITIEGEGLKYETSADILKASQIIAFLNAGERQEENSTSVVASNPGSLLPDNNSKSPREYIIELGAKTNPQKILAFAKYNCDKNQTESFDPTVIKSYFKKSGEPEPRNYSRDLKEAIRLRYIYETDDNDGTFSITAHGNALLSKTFEGETKTSTKQKSQTLKKSSPQPTTEGLQNIEIATKKEGMPDYYKISTKSDRILWILYFAQLNSYAELSSQDISYIADKLMDNIPSKNISGLTEYSLKKAYIVKTNTGFKLIHDGIEHLKSLG